MFLRNKSLSLLIVLLAAQLSAWSQATSTSQSALITVPQEDATAAPSRSSIEYWDKLALRDNNLHPDPPLFGQTDTLPDFTRELLRVQWRSGDPMDLYVVRPAGVAKPPVIIYLYGYPSEATRFLNDSLCRTVTKNGFAAVSFSSALTGQRYHDVPMKEWFVSDLQRSLVATTHDVEMVLNYLAARGDFDMTSVGIFGEGSGGTIALLAASADSRIRAVDTLNPWGDWPSWFKASLFVPDAQRSEYLTPAFLGALAPLDPVNVLPTLSRVPLRLQQNLWQDERTPAAARKRIAAALPTSGQLAQYRTEQEYIELVGSKGRMLDWMYNHLSVASYRQPKSSSTGSN
jgi:acetyl esterase/lipase